MVVGNFSGQSVDGPVGEYGTQRTLAFNLKIIAFSKRNVHTAYPFESLSSVMRNAQSDPMNDTHHNKE
jgi:hypothetical protein